MSVGQLWRRVSRPMRWEVRTRRLFMITFFIAIPLWLLAVMLIGFLKGFTALVAPLRRFWAEPPRHRMGYYGYKKPLHDRHRGHSAA